MLITIFITYIKRKIDSEEVYAGRTSGKVSAITPENVAKVLRKRDSGHQRNKEGFDKAEFDQFSTKYEAIRGREQHLIDYFKTKGVCANLINGISLRNKKRALYLTAAVESFGELMMLIWLFN